MILDGVERLARKEAIGEPIAEHLLMLLDQTQVTLPSLPKPGSFCSKPDQLSRNSFGPCVQLVPNSRRYRFGSRLPSRDL